MSLFCVITLLCFSYAEDWGEVDNVISFGDSSNRVNWEYGLINLYGVDFDSFYFNSECCSSYNMVFEDQYSLNGFGRYLQFALNETIFVHSFFIRISSNSTFLFIDCDKLAAETNLYIGCFNNELICRNSLIDNLRTHITTNSNMLTIFGENDQKILLNFNQYFNVERPFIYIGGLIQQTVSVNITSELPDSEDLNELYVFTGNIRIDGYFNSNINNISMEFIIEEVDTYKIEAVCTRNGISRYLFYTKDSISSENCDCYAVGSNYYYSKDTLFNYPDCVYNSTLFNFVVNNYGGFYSLSEDLCEWYSFQLTASYQHFTSGCSLMKVKEMDINYEDTEFEFPLYVSNLTITTTGGSFNIIDFDTLNFSSISDVNGVVLFTTTGTNTNLNDFDLKLCGIYVVTNTTFFNCTCTESECAVQNLEDDSNCDSIKTTYCANLIIEKSVYNVESNEYWNSLTIAISSTTLYGNSQLTSTFCEFENKSVVVGCDLYCETMSVNSASQIYINGTLEVNTLIISGSVADNLNENGIIQSIGTISLNTIEIESTQSNCFELISSTSTLTNPELFSNEYSSIILSQDHLLRICPTINQEKDVECVTNNTFFEQGSFTTIHCPCNSELCTVIIENTSFNFNNVVFEGVVDIQIETSISFYSINTLQLNGNSIVLSASNTTPLIINKIVNTTGSIELLNDCNIYSSNIPAIINKANVYLFNETITIKELIVTSNYRQLIVNSSVNSVNLSTVTVNEESNYLSIGIITTEGSSNTLTITSLPSSNYPSSIIFLLQKERPIEFVQEIECDNQAIIINPTETTCNDFNLFNHYCYYSHEDIYYQSNLEKIDYSCPCNKNQSNCTIELDKTSHTTFTQLYPVTNFIINQESTITPLNNFNIHLTSDVTVTLSTVTNNIISVSNNSVNFCLNLTSSSDGYLLLVSNVLGLSQQTRNIKSSTLQYTISNDYYCKSLYIENGEDTCIICDSSFNTNGYCSNSLDVIENCQILTIFGCEVCYEGYESNVTNCNECSSNCLRCYNDECINCGMNYQLNETNQCELITNELIEIFDNNKTMKCNDGYYSNTNQCIKCSDLNCITCNSSQCLTCNSNYTLNNGNCQQKESNNGEEIISNYGVIDCNEGYYSNNLQCIDCSLTFDNCELCNINGCLSCSNGVIINNRSCSLNTNCLNIDDSICLSCNDKGSWFNGNECEECGDNCKNCVNGYCIECNDGYILQSENNCTENEYPNNCITLSYCGTCQRCSNGYYLNDNLCNECSSECTKCHNLTYCFECKDGYMLNSTNECVDMSESNANCKTAIPGSSGGCAICNDGYYRNQTSCYSCISNCNKCNNGESCLICESNYFLLNDASECIPYDDLTNCETKTQSGCTKCNDTYYLNNQYCTSCSDTTENCNTCNKKSGKCLTCQNDYILINYECIDYQLIDNCKESNDSKCTSCSFWHTLNSDQTGCDTQAVWWVIVLIILIVIALFIVVILLFVLGMTMYFDYRKTTQLRKEICIFNMSRSNIQFSQTNNQDVVINKDEILFNDECEEIKVNEETRDLICVGNISKHTIKVQFSVKDVCDKYEIRTNPQLITIPKRKAVEFEIFIKPLCTCKINDQIMLISVDLTKGKTITTPINVNTITIMTTHLDYSELIEENKLGEGSFGIVYKGTFRENQVAIKKMKNAQDNVRQIEEFNKEVAMLDKFRNEYIVHFYGAVFIPHKICMVTEFAQYGSLQDLMNKTKGKPIDDIMKLKILLDCSNGIQYLHSNGILHRDIKPDNFLIFSLDMGVQVNAKLTDFGTSRNINMLMTNMTFTKGIGTPVYMAPEILNKEKYKKSADIYSFAITIYETMIWDYAYPKEQFKFPWDIAEFITQGKHLSKPVIMKDSTYEFITKCWCKNPKERYTIEEVIKELEQL